MALGEDFVAAGCEEAEERFTGDDAGLDDFVEARVEFALREGGEDGGVDQDSERLVEGSDEILACGEVRSGFATNGGVDLSEERGGNLNNRDAPHVDGGEETAKVVDDAATEGDDEAGAVGTTIGHLLGEGFDMRHPLVFFRTGEKESGVVVGTEGGLKMGAVQFPDVGGGNDEDFSGAGREKLGEARDSTSFNYDGVGSLGGRDLVLGHLFHCGIGPLWHQTGNQDLAAWARGESRKASSSDSARSKRSERALSSVGGRAWSRFRARAGRAPKRATS